MTTRTWRTVAVVLALGSAIAPAPAAAQYLGGGTMTPAETLIADLEDMARKFVALANAIPEESWDWRPMDGTRSVRDVLALIAVEPTLFPTMWGFDAPAWLPDPEIGAELSRLRALAKADMVVEIERSFAHVRALASGLDDGARARRVGFFGLEVPLETAIGLMANDMHEHLGQLIAYARMNRIVPPWSRPSR